MNTNHESLRNMHSGANKFLKILLLLLDKNKKKLSAFIFSV